MGKVIVILAFLWGITAILAGCVDQEAIARYQAEAEQARALQAQAAANQAQALAMTAQVQAAAEQDRVIYVVLFGVAIWATVMIAALIAVILTLARRPNQEAPRVVYMMPAGYAQPMQPNHRRPALQQGSQPQSVIVWPQKVREDVYPEY